MVKIHVCGRCEGCGYVTGSRRWEIAWSRWAGGRDDATSVLGAHPCPDCGGTGALIEQDVQEPEPALPTRRGLGARNRYARHVSAVLQSQARRD